MEQQEADQVENEDIFRGGQEFSGQVEMPFAYVNGEAVTQLPDDLYIPPDALEVFLEAFEGPLDLLLYLIKRQNIDILNIPIAEITKQYVEYVELMKDMRLELAGEYLVMAAMLAEIKSRMLLPRPVEENDEDDPRAELIRRLQEYERYKSAAEDLDQIPRVGRDIYQATVEASECRAVKLLPEVDLKELLASMLEVVSRADLFTNHQIQRETLSVRERMSQTLEILTTKSYTEVSSLFRIEEGKLGVVVTFLAILELIKGSMVEIIQREQFAPIYARLRS
ncbi:MAG: segregation/condensation protein A [Gammaproteobacteria bacterium]|nr:MAG: segregation/condensation protein A [Gammaproteobacteria bacterium]